MLICEILQWSLWQGMHGNLFCCEVGKVGVYNNNGPRAGTCVEPGNTGDQLPAVIVSLFSSFSVWILGIVVPPTEFDLEIHWRRR